MNTQIGKYTCKDIFATLITSKFCRHTIPGEEVICAHLYTHKGAADEVISRNQKKNTCTLCYESINQSDKGVGNCGKQRHI